MRQWKSRAWRIETIGLNGCEIMNIFVVAYCGYDDFDSPILLVTPNIELAKKFAKEALLSDANYYSNVVVERWDEKERIME